MDNLHDQRTLGTEDIQVYRYTISEATYQVKLMAYPIQIRWKPEDRLATTTSTDATTSTSSNATAGTGGSSYQSSGLSTGAKTGIGVGAGVLGLAAIAFIGWWLRRLAVTRRGKAQNAPTTPNLNYMYQKPELDGGHVHVHPGQNMARPAEIWTETPRAELVGLSPFANNIRLAFPPLHTVTSSLATWD